MIMEFMVPHPFDKERRMDGAPGRVAEGEMAVELLGSHSVVN
jgi:hypothetical protein